MSDKLMLGLEDLDEVSEDEQYESELKSERSALADRAFVRRQTWLNTKGMNWKKRRRRKRK